MRSRVHEPIPGDNLMAGPYPPHRAGSPYGGQPLPYPEPFPVQPPYQGPPPPARSPRRGRAVLAVLVSLAVVAGIVTAAVLAGRDSAPPTTTTSMGLTADAAKVAIQNYLDALSDGDIQTISRNTLCGLYDGVKDRRTDDALARLSSDAFQKQFSKVEVTSVDTMVFTSPNSAQVLFTMKVVPAAGSKDGGGIQRQAVAQLLSNNNEILVCSYVQRTAGTF